MGRQAWQSFIEALDLAPRSSPSPETLYVGARRGWPIELRWQAARAVVRVGDPARGCLHLSARSPGGVGMPTGDARFDAQVVAAGAPPPLVLLDITARRRVREAIATGARLTETGAWWSLATPPPKLLLAIDRITAALDALAPPDGPALIWRAADEPPPVAAAAAAILDARIHQLPDPAQLADTLADARPPRWDHWLACLAPFPDKADRLRACATPFARIAWAALFGDPDRPDAAAALIDALSTAPALTESWCAQLNARPDLRAALFENAPHQWREALAALDLDVAGRAQRMPFLVDWDWVDAIPTLLTALGEAPALAAVAARCLARLIDRGAPLPARAFEMIGWHAPVLVQLDAHRTPPDALACITPRTDAARIAWAECVAAAPRTRFEPALLALLPSENRRVVDAALRALEPCATPASRAPLSAIGHPRARAILARLDPTGRLSDTDVTHGQLAAPKKPRNLS